MKYEHYLYFTLLATFTAMAGVLAVQAQLETIHWKRRWEARVNHWEAHQRTHGFVSNAFTCKVKRGLVGQARIGGVSE